MLKDRGFDPSRVLVPTTVGPDSDLSAEVAGYLRGAFGSEVRLLHVVDDVECSVLLAERPTRRSLRDRLFG